MLGHYHYEYLQLHLIQHVSATYYVLGTGLETGDAKISHNCWCLEDTRRLLGKVVLTAE